MMILKEQVSVHLKARTNKILSKHLRLSIPLIDLSSNQSRDCLVHSLLKQNVTTSHRQKTSSGQERLTKIQVSALSRGLIRICSGLILDSQDATFLHADNEDWSDCADTQVDLSLRCTHMHVRRYFSYVEAHLFKM